MHSKKFLSFLTVFLSGVSNAVPLAEDHSLEKRACAADNLMRLFKANLPLATPFCSSLLHIPTSTITVSTYTPTATATTTHTNIVTTTLTQTSDMTATTIGATTTFTTGLPVAANKRALSYPAWLPTTYAASSLSSICSCLSIPATTTAVTATASSVTSTSTTQVTSIQTSSTILSTTITTLTASSTITSLPSGIVKVNRVSDGSVVGDLYGGGNMNAEAVGSGTVFMPAPNGTLYGWSYTYLEFFFAGPSYGSAFYGSGVANQYGSYCANKEAWKLGAGNSLALGTQTQFQMCAGDSENFVYLDTSECDSDYPAFAVTFTFVPGDLQSSMYVATDPVID